MSIHTVGEKTYVCLIHAHSKRVRQIKDLKRKIII